MDFPVKKKASKQNNMSSTEKFHFAIDRGGTFTDVYAECPGGVIIATKLLSEDPENYDDAPREGIRRILEQVSGVPHPRKQPGKYRSCT